MLQARTEWVDVEDLPLDNTRHSMVAIRGGGSSYRNVMSAEMSSRFNTSTSNFKCCQFVFKNLLSSAVEARL
jgi:hypothetical protein